MTVKLEESDWQVIFNESYQELFSQLINYLPRFISVISLLITGWLIANLLRFFTGKMILAIDAFILQSTKGKGLRPKSMRTQVKFWGNLIFWCVMLFFIIASANILQVEIFATLFNKLVIYLPNLIIGFLIILSGFLLSGVTHSTVVSIARTTGITQVRLLAGIAQACVVLIAVVVGVEQIGIDVSFITTSLIVVIGVLLTGGALAFGIGARLYVANIIGAQTCRSHFKVGQKLKLGDVEGSLLEVTQTSLILETESGRATIPAKLLHELVTEIILDNKK